MKQESWFPMYLLISYALAVYGVAVTVAWLRARRRAYLFAQHEAAILKHGGETMGKQKAEIEALAHNLAAAENKAKVARVEADMTLESARLAKVDTDIQLDLLLGKLKEREAKDAVKPRAKGGQRKR